MKNMKNINWIMKKFHKSNSINLKMVFQILKNQIIKPSDNPQLNSNVFDPDIYDK